MSHYQEITTIGQWKEVLEQSKETPALLLKHSTTCPISANAYREFVGFASPVATYLVKVIESREVSNEIASDVNVQHASPQALLITDGKAVWNATHYKITGNSLAEAVATV